MKSKLLSLFLLGSLWLVGTNAVAQLQKNEEGAYLIGSKADLQEWTQVDGYESTNVVLTGDIEDLDFMLCTSSASYNGVFDGAGHTVTLNYDFSGKQTGMFYNFAGTVKNLIVGGTIKATFKNCAPLAAWSWSGNTRFENVVSMAEILVDWTGNTSNGAFIGYTKYTATFENCVSAIRVSGNQDYNQAFIGWVGNNAACYYNNCLSIMEAETKNSLSFANPVGTVKASNCYSFQQDADSPTPLSGNTYITDASILRTGELCYLLNKGAGKTVYYQTLGEDSYPVPFSSHMEVFANGNVRCDGTALDGDLTFSNTNETPIPQHIDADGWCSVCGSLIQDHLTPDADGFYELSSVSDVEWFGAMVNEAHQTTINGKLTADIDYQGEENAHTPIGLNTTFKYNGIFDGQGHRIKGMIITSTSNMQGFFGAVRGGTIIRNLIIDKSCEISGNGQVAALVGCVQTNAATPVLIENCVNEGTVVGTSSASGFIGAGASAYPVVYLKNCLNTGDITGSPATAFCSWINATGGQMVNCVNTGTITGADFAGGKYSYYCNLIRYEPNTLAMTNCFDFSDFDDEGAGHQGMSDEWTTDSPAESGELCYFLNGDQTNLVWYQRLGTDATPVPFYVAGGTVYAGGAVSCDGTPLGTGAYSNTKSGEIPPHEFEDGFCLNCGNPQMDYCELVDGSYQITNASQLYWFSRMVNEYKYGDWNAVLTDDIDMEMYSDMFMPIGQASSTYRGHFNGQQHVISNLHVNGDSYVGFIGQCGNGALIENMLLDESCSLNGYANVAFVGGTNQMTGTVTMRNLGNMGNVYASADKAAGIYGTNAGSRSVIVIENCFSTGYIEGSTESAAIAGWAGSNNPTITGCWSCSEVSGYDVGKNMYFARCSGTITNCYCTSEVEQQVPLIDYEDIMNGALCYKLNGDQSKISWYQNLDNGETVDEQPLPFSNGHAQVYPKGKMLCDGTVDPTDIAYSNSDNVVIPDHHFEDGFCSVCGQEDADYEGFLKVIVNPDFTSGNSGWEGDALSATGGVAQQTGKTFDSYQDIQDLQPGVYKLRAQGFTRPAAIDDEATYAEGELTDDLLRNTYLYAESNGLRVARRLMDITADAQSRKLNDGVGEVQMVNEKYVPTTAATAAVYFGKGKYWNKPLYLAVTEGTLRIGVHNQIQSTGCWSVVDRLRLEYVGDDDEAYALIAKQIADDAQELGDIEGQESLKDEYSEIVEQAEGMTDKDEILVAADKAARYPDAVKLSVAAYKAFYAVVDAIIAEWENRDDLVGENADILETYLTEEEGPSDLYPNGTYQYIRSSRLLSIDELAAETKFAQQLYQNAVKNSIEVGSDLTSLIVNANFNEDAWAGWTMETYNSQSGWNMVCNGGFGDVFPVAAGYNTSFEVSQELVGLPNGIYELTANALHRPGQGGEGLFDGTDIIPARLFMNDYATPVKSVYADMIDYTDAINGVNCRYDATEDPEAPHNGEQTGSTDRDTGLGLVPDNVYTTSFAFHGGRYVQKVYAIVTNGTMRLGIRNLDKPWRGKNLTIWGGFKLRYQGKKADAINAMLEAYSERIELLDAQRFDQEYFMSQSHIDAIRDHISKAQHITNVDQQMELLKMINDEFNAIDTSVAIYDKLEEISQFASDMADGLPEGELRSAMLEIYDELSVAIVEGAFTDEQAEARIAELMENPAIGGVVYVQGDLYDEESENGEWPYTKMCTLYPMYKDASGKWVGSVTLQDRSRRINGYQRAGLYFRRMNTIYKCPQANFNFITPADNTFAVGEGGTDYQALNGTYDIELDLDAMTVHFTQKDEYNWDNQVYVTGTLNTRTGTTERWKNTEQWPLQHVGNGVYVGTVDMVYDNANPFCSFGIMACRSTNNMVNYSTTARSNWTTARYGSEEQYLEISSGQQLTNLARGLDRTWRISPAGKYLIEFDMNHRTMTATLVETKGKGTEASPYLIATTADLQAMPDRLVSGKTTYFKLTDDIDMAGKGWWPMNSTFFGNSYTEGYEKYVNLDGNNHVIKNLTVAANKENEFETGFFGTLSGSVRNLGFYNATVDGGNTLSAGVLAGNLGFDTYVDANAEQLTTKVENTYVSGAVNGSAVVGGMAGTIYGPAVISNCYANAKVTSEDANLAGDMVGMIESDLTIQNSYAAGRANGSEAAGLLGAGQTCTQQNALYYDGKNQDALCKTVAAWTGWNNDGAIGNGFPLLDWQVAHGNYSILCGFPGGVEQGDVNGDGSVDVADVVAIYNVMATGQTSPTADVNGDGSVDVADVVAIYNIMAAKMKEQKLKF